MHGMAIGHRPEIYPGADAKGPPASAPTSPDTPRNARRRLGIAGKLAWSGAGFLLGAGVWHFIGFWSFISYVVLGGPAPGGSVYAPRPTQMAAADSTPVARRTGSACVTLALDRTTGETRREPCEVSALSLPHVDTSGREDMVLLQPSPPTISPDFGPEQRAHAQND